MKYINEFTKNLYVTDEYITKNPSLHEEDSPWKVSKIILLIDQFVDFLVKDEINLLDIGGGAGLILSSVAAYIKDQHNIKVNKYALELSPGMLEIQTRMNPDLKIVLNEDVQRTSLGDKEIDLTLMIDLLEHVPDPERALQELRRISKYAILKVPLEDNLILKVWNILMGGRPRQKTIEKVGHINLYNFKKLKYQINKCAGQILNYYYTNVFEYLHESKHYRNKMRTRNKIINQFARYLFMLSPRLCSCVFNDFIMILIKCY